MCIFLVFYVFSQEGERVQPPSLEKEMVATGGDQVHWTRQVEVVSKILCIV